MKFSKEIFFIIALIGISPLTAMETPFPGKRKADEISVNSKQEDINPTQQLLNILESSWAWAPEDEQVMRHEVEDLLEEGADPNARNDHNIPALILATKTWNAALVALLLEYNANPDIQTNDGKTALHFSTDHHARFGGTPDIIRILLAYGANANIQDKNGENALTSAILVDDIQAVDLLLKAGADPDMKSYLSGETSLHSAVIFKSRAVIQRLLEAGADPNIQNNLGNTPLQTIIQLPNLEIARMLLQAGANPHITNNNGESALSLLKRLINETQGEYFLQVMQWISHPETLPKTGFEKLTSETYELIEPILKGK